MFVVNSALNLMCPPQQDKVNAEFVLAGRPSS